MKSLAPMSYLEAKNQNKERLKGTCEWFTEHAKFKQWDAARTSSMLYVSADPGCGKSVLARYLVDSVLCESPARILCYFFFKENIEQQSLAVNALQCILHQIFSANGNLLSPDLLNRFENSQKILSSVHDLWDILIRVVQDKRCKEVVCIIDALDECAEQGRESLASCLNTFYRQHRKGIRLKFLVTSRPYKHISMQLLSSTAVYHSPETADISVIHLQGDNEDEVEKISREINIVVEAKANDMRKDHSMSDREFTCLLEELQKVPNRTYLWAHLVLDWLKTEIGFSMSDIKTLSSRLPHTVNDAYEAILSRSKHDRDKVLELLHIVVASKRALTLEEMDVALAIESHHKTYQDLKLRGKRVGDYVRDLCGLFVAIIDSKIYFLHQTAKEFLVHNSDSPHDCGTWKHTLQPQESHRILFHVCSRVLLLEECRSRPDDADRTKLGMLNVDWNHYDDQHTMFIYSADSWVDHCKLSCAEETEILAALLNMRNTGSSGEPYVRLPWLEYYFEVYDDIDSFFLSNSPVPPLYISARLGLSLFVSELLQQDLYRDHLETENHSDSYSPLFIASQEGHTDVVRVLISHFDNELQSNFVNETNDDGMTSLMVASCYGQLECMKLLLEAGANVHERDTEGSTALVYCSYRCSQEAAKLLLDYGACVGDIRGALGRYKHRDYKFLLELFGQEVFFGAISPFICEFNFIKYHDIIIIRGWLSNGLDVNIRASDGNTLLIHACKTCGLEVALDLIKHSADIALPDYHGYKPLWYCNTIKHTPFIRAILDAASWRECSDDNWLPRLISTKPLSQYSPAELQALEDVKYALSAYAALYDDIDFVKFLHTTDTMAYKHTGSRITDLQWAILSKSEKVTAYLLNCGGDIHNLGGVGENPLHWAVLAGSHGLIRELLSRGADINRSSQFGTPLSYAVMMTELSYPWPPDSKPKSRDLSSLMAFRGGVNSTEPEVLDYSYRDGLLRALVDDSSATVATVELLLSNGSNTNTFNRQRRTPLFHAKSCLIIRLLVSHGADLDARDIDGFTPLLNATEPAVVRELLGNGANINADNIWGQTLLMLAVQRDISTGGSWQPTLVAEHLILNGACVSGIHLTSGNSESMKTLIRNLQSSSSEQLQLLS